MEQLRVFLSSTCFDLRNERLAIRNYLSSLGHIPILSDKNNIRYDPDKNTHASCMDTVENGTDYMVSVISTRFGGTIFREAFLKHINVNDLKAKTKTKTKKYLDNSKFSISQCEVFKAIEKGIPCLIFVHKTVSDERKKYMDALKKGRSSTPYTIKNPDAVFIFDFIGFVNNLYVGNGTYEYKTVNEIKNVIKNSFSNHFRDLLKDKINVQRLKYPLFIPESNEAFGKLIIQKLSADYKKQKARLQVENKLVFDEYCNCDYYLSIKINPISECPLYHIQLISDKEGEMRVKKFRNIDSQKEDAYIGIKGPKTLDLFLFNNAMNLKAPFNIELQVYIENYLSELVEDGKGHLTKSLHGKNTTYVYIKQQMLFKKDSFKNLQIVCKQHPAKKKINEVLKPVRKAQALIFEYSYKTQAIPQGNDPAIRLEITRD